MNRDILFRGKRVDNGEWIYGSLVTGVFVKSATGQDIPYIFNTDECDNADCFEDFTDNYGYYEVDPSTVGQHTGLADKNGVKIFEGDVLHFKTYSGGGFGRVGLDAYSEVIYGEHNLSGDYTIGRAIGFYLNCDEDNVSIQYWVNSHKATVVGNRFDNPELIK